MGTYGYVGHQVEGSLGMELMSEGPQDFVFMATLPANLWCTDCSVISVDDDYMKRTHGKIWTRIQTVHINTAPVSEYYQ